MSADVVLLKLDSFRKFAGYQHVAFQAPNLNSKPLKLRCGGKCDRNRKKAQEGGKHLIKKPSDKQ